MEAFQTEIESQRLTILELRETLREERQQHSQLKTHFNSISENNLEKDTAVLVAKTELTIEREKYQLTSEKLAGLKTEFALA
jgi:hypothetical protein